MRFADYLKQIGLVQDTALILQHLLANPDLLAEQRRLFIQALEECPKQLSFLNDVLGNTSDRTPLLAEISEEAIEPTVEWVRQLRNDPLFDAAFKPVSNVRNLLIELMASEDSFINNYLYLHAHRATIIEVVNRYCGVERSAVIESFAETLEQYGHAKNHLSLTYSDMHNLVDNVFFGLEWLYGRFFNTTDFINYYDHDLRRWTLTYVHLSKLVNEIKLAVEQKKFTLNNPAEKDLLKHADTNLSGGFQRIGRYALLTREITGSYATLLQCAWISSLSSDKRATYTRDLSTITTFIEAKNKQLQQELGTYDYPGNLLTALRDFIKELKKMYPSMMKSKFFSSLFKAEAMCGHKIRHRLSPILVWLENAVKEFEMTDKTRPQNLFAKLKEIEQCAYNIRTILRTEYKEMIVNMPNAEISKAHQTAFYNFLFDYLINKFQPLSPEDKILLSDQATIPASSSIAAAAASAAAANPRSFG